MLTKTGAEISRLNDMAFRESHPAKGITADDVINYMKSKHNLDTQVIPTNLRGLFAQTKYQHDPDGVLRRRQIRRLQREEARPEPRRKSARTARNAKLELLKHLRQQNTGDFISADERVMRENPAVVGRELGRAAGRTTARGAGLVRAVRSGVGRTAPIMGLMGAAAGSPAVGLTGMGLMGARTGILIGDEMAAQRRANAAMRELGHKHDSDALRRDFVTKMSPRGIAASYIRG